MKRIILLSDGTGNAAGKVWRTNVWRIFESLELTGSNQVAIYDDGVGTSSFKPLAILGGAFGWGLKRNILDLYKFVCRNYQSSKDEIFGFGFSRGAFTMRMVVGLIINQGLVPYETEAQLAKRAKDAYRAFRRENFHTVLRVEKPFRWLRDLVIPNSYHKSDNRTVERIRFLGLWDSVAAYGLPVDEMTRGVSEWIWALELPERRLCDQVQRACHALALDDERTTFHPVLWNERHEKPAPEGQYAAKDERISQVWFAGMHSNVGGGYPDDSLAHIPLCWIMDEAQACGLKFKTNPPAEPDAMALREAARDKDGRLYDSRSGVGGYYRYGPRKILDLCHMRFSKNPDDEVEIKIPKIHESALRRIREGAHVYAPVGFPAEYAVVNDKGMVLPPAENPYESPKHAHARAKAQEEVWNLVWLRRVIYFATVLASLYLLLYPLVQSFPPAAEYATPLRPVSDLIRFLGGFAPGALKPWLDAYARDPGHFLLAAAAVGVLILMGSMVGAKITDGMRGLWRSDMPVAHGGLFHDLAYSLRTSRPYQWVLWALKRHIVPFGFAVLLIYLGVTLASHLLFNFQDAAGLVCQERPVEYQRDPRHPNIVTVKDYKRLIHLKPGETMLAAGGGSSSEPDPAALPVFRTSELCQSTGVWLERDGRYRIAFDSTDSFKDKDIEASEGFTSNRAPTFGQRAAMFAALPLRREILEPWFRVVAQTGGKGGEETPLDPEFTDNKVRINKEIKATRDGELFLFVNDAVIGIPGFNGYFYKFFYDNNKGSARVTIKRL
jgi:uncharacterized protein (DUF2235 family)